MMGAESMSSPRSRRSSPTTRARGTARTVVKKSAPGGTRRRRSRRWTAAKRRAARVTEITATTPRRVKMSFQFMTIRSLPRKPRGKYDSRLCRAGPRSCKEPAFREPPGVEPETAMSVRDRNRDPRPSPPRLSPLLLLPFAYILGCAGFHPGPVGEAGFAATVDGFAARRVRFLELAVRQLRHPAPGYGPSASRYAQGTLAAAALAVRGEPTAGEAAHWAEAALDGCAGRWEKVECEAVLLAFQRVVLDAPGAVPSPLLDRLREVASRSAPPPSSEAVLHPWSFKETENQRAVTLARSLVAQVVAGTPESSTAQAWGEYALAFLAAHDRDGWYEQESPGYLAFSIAALLQLADHAPQAAVRDGATRQLNVLFAAWAQEQVGGFPAGAKSRTYVHWALGERNTPWMAWAWLLGGLGRQERLFFLDAPELAVTAYRVPLPIRRLLAKRRREPPYEIRVRRSIDLSGRRDLDAARYSYATP